MKPEYAAIGKSIVVALSSSGKRPSEIAESIRTSADGHGNRPPEIPSASRLRHVSFSGLQIVTGYTRMESP